jgi:putative transposase
LFAAIDEMRGIERQAQTLTRTARRNRARRQVGTWPEKAPMQIETTVSTVDIGPVRPFDDIEPW